MRPVLLCQVHILVVPQCQLPLSHAFIPFPSLSISFSILTGLVVYGSCAWDRCQLRTKDWTTKKNKNQAIGPKAEHRFFAVKMLHRHVRGSAEGNVALLLWRILHAQSLPELKAKSCSLEHMLLSECCTSRSWSC